MSGGEALRRLLAGMQHDLADYRQLQQWLQQQCRAALAHDAAQLAQLGAAISEQCAVLEARRRERSTLVRALAAPGRAPSVAAVLAGLPPRAQAQADALWQSLQQLLLQCQAQNRANGELLASQQQRLTQILFGEQDSYAPRTA